MRFSRQEYWNGLSFPSPGDLPNPGIKPVSLGSPALAGGFFTSTTWEAPTVMRKGCHSVYCSPPGASVHEIRQARMLAWLVISFSRGRNVISTPYGLWGCKESDTTERHTHTHEGSVHLFTWEIGKTRFKTGNLHSILGLLSLLLNLIAPCHFLNYSTLKTPFSNEKVVLKNSRNGWLHFFPLWKNPAIFVCRIHHPLYHRNVFHKRWRYMNGVFYSKTQCPVQDTSKLHVNPNCKIKSLRF